MEDIKKEMPLGLVFLIVLNETAMVNFAKMPDTQRQEVIRQSKRVKTKAEMSRLVDRIASNEIECAGVSE